MSLTGQEWLVVKHQLLAIYDNILSWLLVILRVRTSRLVLEPLAKPAHAAAVQIVQPGGYESFRQVDLDAPAANGDVLATVGYNVQAGVERVDGCASLVRVALDGSRGLPPACVLVAIDSFSVNYADVTIRWGLYESAIRYVGYPIVPGFDFAGTVLAAGAEASVAVGARVMGVTFFGGYSQRLVVPSSQLRPVPAAMSQRDAAALSSVAGTALHSLALAGFWPGAPLTANRAVLIHSAAGGVGSMLVQMAKLLGCAPVVAVVGAPHKMAACHALGAHVVIDKSSADLWTEAARAAPTGFAAVFDANGVATLAQSYHALSKTGRLIVCVRAWRAHSSIRPARARRVVHPGCLCPPPTRSRPCSPSPLVAISALAPIPACRSRRVQVRLPHQPALDRPAQPPRVAAHGRRALSAAALRSARPRAEFKIGARLQLELLRGRGQAPRGLHGPGTCARRIMVARTA
jgi:2-desacetyl-2-hydroxyethyl bacteriochlorophyllide A dehydrogenase